MMSKRESISSNPPAKSAKLMEYVREEMQRHKQREAIASQPDQEANAQVIGSLAISSELTPALPADETPAPAGA